MNIQTFFTDILGFGKQNYVGEKWESQNTYSTPANSGATDNDDEEYQAPNKLNKVLQGFGRAESTSIIPYHRYGDSSDGITSDLVGNFLSERGFGTYNLIPSRPYSAQLRMKNWSNDTGNPPNPQNIYRYELPAYTWTRNPEGDPYIVRVPGLPQQQLSLATLNGFTSQPEYLQPITNLQIQNDMNWLARFRAAIFGQAQEQVSQAEQNMFPSIFNTGQ